MKLLKLWFLYLIGDLHYFCYLRKESKEKLKQHKEAEDYINNSAANAVIHYRETNSNCGTIDGRITKVTIG